MQITSWKKTLGYGFLVWLIPFFAAFPIISFKESNRALFESTMSVVLTLVTVVFGMLYLKKVTSQNALSESAVVGFIWMAISLLFDSFLFSWGPMKMSLMGYILDIGFAYVMIPTIVVGMGSLIKKHS